MEIERLFLPNFIAIICMVVFIGKYDHIKKQDTKVAKLVFSMALLDIAGAAVSLIYNVAAVRLGNGFDSDTWITVFISGLVTLREFVVIQILVGWKIFIAFVLYRSKDLLKRKYNRKYIPMAIISVIVFLLYFSPRYNPSGNVRLVAMVAFTLFVLAVQLYFMIGAYMMVRKTYARRRPPTTLRLDIFMIPFVVGFLLGLINSPWIGDLRFLCFAIAIVLTWRTVEKNYLYRDPFTGFYNKYFLADMNDYMEKSGYPNGVGVMFQSTGNGNKLVSVLQSMKPDDSDIFCIGADEYLLMAGKQNDDVLELLIKSIRAGAEYVDPTMVIKAAYAIREPEESSADFTARLLKLSVKEK